MVDYCDTDIAKNPHCAHGPTLLFSRKNNLCKYYSCSAFRDRKKCSYYRRQDDAKQPTLTDSFKENVLKFAKNRETIKTLSACSEELAYCCSCEFIVSKKQLNIHKCDCRFIKKFDRRLLQQPTKILQAKSDSKGQSQFYFSDETLGTFVEFLHQLSANGVLCIGCPHLFEFLSREKLIKRLLLDIDYRFLQFYEPGQFQLFNLFNCHMFESDGWEYVKRLAEPKQNVFIIVDPPFGGRLEALAYTLRKITSVFFRCHVIALLVLPYFMEPEVSVHLPGFSMLDYKVNYENHRTIKRRGTSNLGSMVRIFTNADPSRFVLPSIEGYKFCDICNRWVCEANNHCFKCAACTSKNGGKYWHCDICRKCVKETWTHCDICKICKLSQHDCTTKGSFKES